MAVGRGRDPHGINAIELRNEVLIDMTAVKRISVVGSSGSGKTTVGRRLAHALDVPFIELDALHWGPNWAEPTAEQFRARVQDVVDADAWVIDGNYNGKLNGLVWQYADTVVWLDPPRWRVMSQSVTRTVHRVVTRRQLWAGNRERWQNLMFWRGEESILWWAWTGINRNRARYRAAMTDPQYAHLRFRRLTSRRQVRALVRDLAAHQHGSAAD